MAWAGRSSEAERINCHHNFTAQETHFGKDGVAVPQGCDRRGRRGVPGLIPGSMGTASYVVAGKGNPARAELVAARRRAATTRGRPRGGRSPTSSCARRMAGIEYRDTDAFIDEIPAAYKDIDQVMADAADLVEIGHTLRQIVNVKGD